MSCVLNLLDTVRLLLMTLIFGRDKSGVHALGLQNMLLRSCVTRQEVETDLYANVSVFSGLSATSLESV